MAGENYVGHDNQLQHIAEELRPRAADSLLTAPVSLLFQVRGPQGAGKRTFIKRAWTLLCAGEVPRVLFTLAPSTDNNIAEQLLAGAQTNRSYLDDCIELIAEEISGQSKRLEEAGRPLPPEARLTLWSDLVTQRLMDDPRNNRGLQIIFALPEFLTFMPAQREAIAREIPRSNSNVDCRIIVTGPSTSNTDELARLFPERTPIDDIPLPALTLEEVESWAQIKQIPQEFAAEIYKRCGGLPERLEKSSAAVISERQERLLMILAEESVDGFSTEEKKCVCMSAMLPEVNQKTLQLIMPPEQAASTMQVLRRCDWNESGWRDDCFVIGPEIRRALVKYLEKHFAEDFRKALPLAEQFAAIHTLMPSVKIRENLARLSVFNYFNDALIRELMPVLADEVLQVVQSNQGFFELSGSNYKLKPEIRQIVEAYIKLSKYVVSDEERAKISAAWEARRRKIMDLMNASEEKVKRDTEALSAVQAQIKQATDNIDAELNRLNKMRRKAQRQNEKPDKPTASAKGIQIGSLAMQGFGFVILYISFLLYSKSSLIYAAIGLGLIIGGLFVKGGMLATSHTPSTSNNTSNSADLDKHEKNLHFLNIKRGQLESRQNLVAMNIARERSSLKEFDKQLREPYS